MAPGTLFLVLGPSGAGKDTCLDGAREIMADSPHTVFAKRWITRDPEKCSDLEMPVTPEEMDLKSDMCELALFWEAHDTMYAVGNEIKVQLAQGINVVINVSRTCIQTAQMKFKKVRVINITASEDVLLERLTARARDSVESIKERIARSKMLEPNGPYVIDVVNEGMREEGVQGVVDALQAYEPRPPPRVIFMADGHADPASQLAIASAVQEMELPDGVDLWMEMILPEEVKAMRVAFEEPSAAEEFFLDMEQQGGAEAEEPASEEEVRPAEPEEGAGTEDAAGEEGADAAVEEAAEEVEPYGGLYCHEAALSKALKVPLARLGWPAELEASLVALLRTAHAHGSVLHALDVPEFTLAVFEEKRLAEQPPAAAEGEEKASPGPSEDAQKFKARMEYAHDRVNRASHRWLERLEAYGGMEARPQLVLCGAEHWQTLADGLKTRGLGEPVALEALAVQVAPPTVSEPAEGEEAPAPAEDAEAEAALPAEDFDPIAAVTKACEERNALLRAPRSASLFGDEESEDDMEVEPMLGAVLGIHHPTLFAPAAIIGE